MAKIAFVGLLLSQAIMRSLSLYQLDIENVFFRGDPVEEEYKELPPGFAAQGESSSECRLCCSLNGLKQPP